MKRLRRDWESGLEKIRSGERLSVGHRWVKNVSTNRNGQIWITLGGDRVAAEWSVTRHTPTPWGTGRSISARSTQDTEPVKNCFSLRGTFTRGRLQLRRGEWRDVLIAVLLSKNTHRKREMYKKNSRSACV